MEKLAENPQNWRRNNKSVYIIVIIIIVIITRNADFNRTAGECHCHHVKSGPETPAREKF